MATDLTREGFNASTVDVVATVGTLTASDRAGVTRASGAYKVGVLPAGAILRAVYVVTTKTFDAATTISVGDGTTAGKWVAALTAVTSIGTIVGTLGLNVTSTVAQDIVVTLASGGAVTGEVSIYMEYIDTAARREIFTA